MRQKAEGKAEIWGVSRSLSEFSEMLEFGWTGLRLRVHLRNQRKSKPAAKIYKTVRWLNKTSINQTFKK